MLEQARAETLADSAEVRPHLRFPMNSRRAEFQDSMMNEPLKVTRCSSRHAGFSSRTHSNSASSCYPVGQPAEMKVCG